MASDYLLGIDGGATKSAGVLCAPDGRIVARKRVGGCHIPNGQRLPPASREELVGLVNGLCADTGLSPEVIGACGIGINGIDFDDEFDMHAADVAAALALPNAQVSLVNDGIIALWGGTSAPASVIIQHGTGLTTAWRREPGGETIFDSLNVGRIFDIRQEAIVAVARMIDGRAEMTGLKDVLLSHFGVADASRFAEKVFRGCVPRGTLRSTPPLIYRAWQQGDTVAARLVRRAVDDYVLAARALAARTQSETPWIGFGGGVITVAPRQFLDLLRAGVLAQWPHAVVGAPELLPEDGAVVMAAFRRGIAPEPVFRQLASQK